MKPSELLMENEEGLIYRLECHKVGEKETKIFSSMTKEQKEAIIVLMNTLTSEKTARELYTKKWRLANPDKAKAWDEKRRSDPEKRARRNAQQKARRLANPEKVALYNSRSYGAKSKFDHLPC